MKTAATLLVLPFALICSFATEVRGQNQEQPPQLTANATENAANPWLSMTLSYGAFADGGSNAVGQTFAGGLDHQWLLKRSRIGLSGNASTFLYSATSGLSQVTFGGTLSATHQLTRRARVSVFDTVSRGYARQSTLAILSDARLVAPTAIVRSYDLGGSFGYDVSPRIQIQGSVHYDRYSFDPPTAAGPAATLLDSAVLAGGQLVGSGLSVQRQVSRHDTLGVGYELSRGQSGGSEHGTTQAMHASWQRTLGRSFTVSADGGVSTFRLQPINSLRLTPTGAISFSQRLKDSALAVRFERGIEISAGGTHVSETINPSYSLTMRRKLTLGLSGTFARNTFLVSPQYDYQGWFGSATVGYALPAHLVVSGASSRWYRVYSRGSLPSRTTYYSTLLVGYSRSWR